MTSWLPADAQGIGSHASITGALTVGYYSNDLVASQTQGGTTLTFGLDPTQSRFTTSSDGTTTTTSHYADSSDSPAWTSTSATVWSRNVTGPDGGLAATFDQAGNAVLQLANLHGDLVATCTDNTSATGTSSYSESTEFGAPRTAASAPDTYGWLGEKRRSTNDLAGLTLMGVRLYNPTTGRFLSVDPVPGGTDNPYVYVLNPTDQNDLNGMWWGWRNTARWVVRHRSALAGAVAFAACFGGPIVCGIAQAGAWAVRSQQRGWSHYRTNIADGILSGASYGNGQAVRWAGKRAYPQAWGRIRPFHQWAYKAAINGVPAATHFYGNRYRRSW